MIISFSHFIRGVPKGGGQLKFKTSAALRLYPLVGKARGVNPEDNREPNSLRLSGADFGILLETYWHSPFLGVYQPWGEGGSAVWATAYSPNLARPVHLTGTLQAQVRDLTRSTCADEIPADTRYHTPC